MSAIGPKRTSVSAPHMSAFGGKADTVIALRNVCIDPKWTSVWASPDRAKQSVSLSIFE